MSFPIPTWVATESDKTLFNSLLEQAQNSVKEGEQALSECTEQTHPALKRQIVSFLKTAREHLRKVQQGEE